MCRTFFFLFAAATVMAFAFAPASILGDWHMIGLTDSESPVPNHRVDLRFKNVNGTLQGAILNRNNGSEMPLALCELQGDTLRFQMAAPAGLVAMTRGRLGWKEKASSDTFRSSSTRF